MSKNMIEQWRNRWNSFNPAKALVHVPYWSQIKDGVIPPPVSVSIDPCGRCCLRCHHCNAQKVIRGNMMTPRTMRDLVALLVEWKTKSACIGGGGESLMNPYTKELILGLQDAGIEAALITNGIYLHRFIQELGYLSYLGVSVDAATNKTWNAVKGMSAGDSSMVSFGGVIRNMEHVRKRYGFLDFTYKFLALPANYREVYAAAKLAKEIGCTNFHFRPGGAPWFESRKSYAYSDKMRESAGEQLDRARADFEDEKFHIYGVVSKFSGTWTINNSFKKCWASLTTCYISPDGTIGLCCDRRGDPQIELCKISTAKKVWGSPKHRAIHEDIRVQSCPRCTFSHVSEIFENAIMCNRMFYNVL